MSLQVLNNEFYKLESKRDLFYSAKEKCSPPEGIELLLLFVFVSFKLCVRQ